MTAIKVQMNFLISGPPRFFGRAGFCIVPGSVREVVKEARGVRQGRLGVRRRGVEAGQVLALASADFL